MCPNLRIGACFVFAQRMGTVVPQGSVYHIKNEFFEIVNDSKLMANKENGHYRPHFFAVQDRKNNEILWMIPMSSRVEKYKTIVEDKIKRYGRCNTIVIGNFAGIENAFLIQNAFPVIEQYIDHEHTIEGRVVTVHKALEKKIVSNLREVLSMHNRGIRLIYPDIDAIYQVMENMLAENAST